MSVGLTYTGGGLQRERAKPTTAAKPSASGPGQPIGQGGLAAMWVPGMDATAGAALDDTAADVAPLRDRIDHARELEIDPHAAPDVAISTEPVR